VAGEGLAHRGVALERVGDQPEDVDLGGAREVLARVAHRERLARSIAARAAVEGDGGGLRGTGGDEVIAAHVWQRGQRGRAPVDDAVVDESQARVTVLDEHAVDLDGVDEPAEQVGDLALDVPRLVVLQAPA
jgi:hypothetical protein